MSLRLIWFNINRDLLLAEVLVMLAIGDSTHLREGLNQFFLLLHHTGKASYGVQYCCRSYPVLAHLRWFLTRETAKHITNFMKQAGITHITLCFLSAHHPLYLCSTDCTGNLRQTPHVRRIEISFSAGSAATCLSSCYVPVA